MGTLWDPLEKLWRRASERVIEMNIFKRKSQIDFAMRPLLLPRRAVIKARSASSGCRRVAKLPMADSRQDESALARQVVVVLLLIVLIIRTRRGTFML